MAVPDCHCEPDAIGAWQSGGRGAAPLSRFHRDFVGYCLLAMTKETFLSTHFHGNDIVVRMDRDDILRVSGGI
ncbi:MAG: hypothetical protein HY666_05285 [Chloroflexi bacterium]|nr:hypothetical protein [Chloroflexota bacterium]